MKKTICMTLAIIMLACVFTACSENPGNKTDKLNIVCTIFPEYDWVRQILGTHFSDAEVTMLLNSGVDLHSYQPSVDDIIRISTCDVFIYVGGESDSWVDHALDEAINKDMTVINLLEVLGDSVKEEEVVEGMEEDEHDHQDDEHDHKDGEHEEEHEYDEHVWLSLKNAQTVCGVIADKLGKADPDNASDYTANCENYVNQLKTLDTEYTTTVAAAKNKTVIFGDRFPFRYLTDDYSLTYYAAFVGCSSETEASFETVVFLANKVDELELGTILTIEGATHRIAETVVANTTAKNQKIMSMDSIQSVTSKDISDGVTYLSIMQSNLNVLKSALN